jgi:tetratricopeptide (TPR) repeat protein
MNPFAAVEAACKQLRQDPALRMLRILVEPDLDEFFTRWLEQWDRSEQNDQIVLRLDAPFIDGPGYVHGLYDQIQQNRSESAPVLAEQNIELPEPIPFDEAAEGGRKSLALEVARLGSRVEQLGAQLVLALVPKEIAAPREWSREIEALLKRFSSIPVKVATYDRPAAPYHQALVEPRNPIAETIKTVSFRPDPEALQGELEKDLKKPLKALERVNTVLMLAGFDVGFGRLDQAAARYTEALGFCDTPELKAHEAVINYNLGGLKLAQNDAASAVEHFERAGLSALKMENYPLAVTAAMALGECHGKLAAPGQALRYFEEAARLASLGGFWQIASQANLRLGQALSQSGRHEEGRKALQAASDQLEKLGEPLKEMAGSMRQAVQTELAQVERRLGRS